MSNMSYCRFRNTLEDMRDCADAMDEPIDNDEETAARYRLIKLCVRIADDYRDEVEE